MANQYEIAVWLKKKEAQVKRLKSLLREAEQQVVNLKEGLEEAQAVEEAYYIANSK